ncbi:DsbA family protein [Pseudogemmobacter sonorensis]|uniref:DsbA family protein n=1 Tax=Pseudogemmobacter sonorensis TaxID=2989681 RepID=UPI0036B10C52
MTLTRRTLIGSAIGGGLLLAAGPIRAQDADAEAFRRELTHDPDQPVIGNPEGNVTLVEFYDYQCPFCRRGHPELLDMVRTDGNIRLVMKDWPIFGETSFHGLKLGLGAASLGQYEAAHEALMRIEGRRIEAQAMDEAVRAAGVDPATALAAFAQDEARWTGLVARNEAQARAIGLRGTPAYLVGWTLMAGAYDIAIIREAIMRERG